MPQRELRIEVDAKRSVVAVMRQPEVRPNDAVFVYAPGAGSNLHDPFGKYLCEALSEVGFTFLRIQFPYMDEGRRAPDRTPVLEATWRAAIGEARSLGERLIVGGRSMGGRIASHVVAKGEPVDALALFAYPLHSPSKPDVWRDAHLVSITVPTLFCSGTRDSFASPDELNSVAATMKQAELRLLEGADHGFSVRSGSGRVRQHIWSEALHSTMSWLEEVGIL